jgi:hypothetical protein
VSKAASDEIMAGKILAARRLNELLDRVEP